MRPTSDGTPVVRRSPWTTCVIGVIAAAVSLTVACGGGGIGKEVGASLVNIFLPERGAVAYANGRFVTVGKFGIEVSDDGGSFGFLPDTGVLSLAVVFGSAGWVTPDATGLLTSVDGLSWSKAPLPLEEGYGAAFALGRYVLVGKAGSIVTSEDVKNWTAAPSATQQDLLGAAFAGDRFLAVGRDGAALASPDGLTWASLALPASVNLRGIAAGDGVIVVTGDRGTLLRSTDGDSWEVVRTNSKAYLTQVTFGGGRFVVVGENGTVLISSDGAQTFQPVAVDFGPSNDLPNHLYGVTYANGEFVAVGQAIIVSRDGFSWVRASLEHDDGSTSAAGDGNGESKLGGIAAAE